MSDTMVSGNSCPSATLPSEAGAPGLCAVLRPLECRGAVGQAGAGSCYPRSLSPQSGPRAYMLICKMEMLPLVILELWGGTVVPGGLLHSVGIWVTPVQVRGGDRVGNLR